MKLTAISLAALSVYAVTARFVEKYETDQVAINGHEDAEQLYLIELSPGETKMVTEDEKWDLRRVCLCSPPCFPLYRPSLISQVPQLDL